MKDPKVLEIQCAAMKAKMRGIAPKPMGSADSLTEKKYSRKEAAEVFGVSVWTIRRMFQGEKGIVYTGNGSVRRSFVIPESVLMRVYRHRAAA